MNIVRNLTRLLLGRRLPTVDGSVSLPGLDQRVTISRDRYGVAYVDAATDEDAWFGLGYCHGQDRAGQLEVIIRLLRGTLAEVLGADGVPLDRLTRRLQVRAAGEAQFNVARPEVQRQLDAYARGINACYAASRRRPSHEHALLRCEPTRWEGLDCQAFAAYLCFMLAANWDIELLRMRVLESDGPEALAALEPVFPEWLVKATQTSSSSPSGLDRLADDLSALAPLFGVGGGSNAWALSAERTATGRPILANDPHLMPAAPCQWYLARLSTPEWRVAGAAFVGTAAIASGHNAHMAWGVTAGHADHTDLFLEEIGPDGKSVREGDSFRPCEVREERIHVRGGASVQERVLITPRGPIVGPCFPGQRDAMSLAGTWLAPRPYAGLFAVHKARSRADIDEAFIESSTTNVGFVYAHRDGEIGYLLAGDYPVRRRGWGMLPLPGWHEDVGWEPEPLPQSALPRVVNPPEGFVATANAAPMVETDAFLGADWLDGYRQARIVEALAEHDRWDLAATSALQMCTLSLPWRELRDSVLAAASGPDIPSEVLTLLTDWDGRLEPDSPAASVFQFFLAEMVQRTVHAIAPKSAAAALGKGDTELLPYNLIVTRRVGHLVRLWREERPLFSEPWPAVAVAALESALAELTRRFGGQLNGWAWGRVRPWTLVHPFGSQAPLDRLFNVGPIPGRGDAATVHQGGVDLASPTANVIGCPTMRAVIDVGAWENSRFVLLGGQSGNPMSPHYTDQITMWSRGEGIPIHWSQADSDEHAVHKLTLEPGQAAPTSAG